jgi:UDP-3-O-[3-hydroxymyristoyl] glucosamine N-acyltransferase
MPRVIIYEGAEVGKGCILHSGVTIREFCKIGDHNIIQNGSVIGADGFGYFLEPQKGLQPVPQIGIVECEADVFIGANTCIDRATFGTTTIKRGTRIENLVQVGHNNVIDANCEIGSQVGLAGCSHIGSNTKLATNVKVRDHLEIAANSNLAMSTQVFHSITQSGSYAGEGPFPSEQWAKIQESIRTLTNKS